MKTTLVLSARELAKHAVKIATRCGCDVVPHAVSANTLAASGLRAANRWRLSTHEPPVKPVGDLYADSQTEAARVARRLAALLGQQVALDNRDAVASGRRAFVSNARRANPKGRNAESGGPTFQRLEKAHMATVREFGKLSGLRTRTPVQQRRLATLRARLERFTDMISKRYRGALKTNPARSPAARARRKMVRRTSRRKQRRVIASGRGGVQSEHYATTSTARGVARRSRRGNPRDWVPVAEAAKQLRAALKRHFPTIKFSVRSKSYAGGASIDVSYENGPRTSDVDRIAQRFAGADFDAMTDLKSSRESLLVGEGGSMRSVRYGSDYVFVHRKVSPTLEAAIIVQFGATWNAAQWATMPDYEKERMASRGMSAIAIPDGEPEATTARRAVEAFFRGDEYRTPNPSRSKSARAKRTARRRTVRSQGQGIGGRRTVRALAKGQTRRAQYQALQSKYRYQARHAPVTNPAGDTTVIFNGKYSLVDEGSKHYPNLGMVRTFTATGRRGAVYGAMLYPDGRFHWMNLTRRTSAVPFDLAQISPARFFAAPEGNPRRTAQRFPTHGARPGLMHGGPGMGPGRAPGRSVAIAISRDGGPATATSTASPTAHSPTSTSTSTEAQTSTDTDTSTSTDTRSPSSTRTTNPKGRTKNPNRNEAQLVAERLWGTKDRPRFGGYGAAINGLGGQVMMGVVRTDGTWAGYYKGKSWGPVIARAMSSKPYDGHEPSRAPNPRGRSGGARAVRKVRHLIAGASARIRKATGARKKYLARARAQRLARGLSELPGSPKSGRSRARASSAPGRFLNPHADDVERASDVVRTFQDRGQVPLTRKRMRRPAPLSGAAAELGKLVAVAYRSDKFDGKTRDYEHEFSTPLPSLVTDPAGAGLHIVGGRYKITSDGIVN